jgi:hypothetical protein
MFNVEKGWWWYTCDRRDCKNKTDPQECGESAGGLEGWRTAIETVHVCPSCQADMYANKNPIVSGKD